MQSTDYIVKSENMYTPLENMYTPLENMYTPLVGAVSNRTYQNVKVIMDPTIMTTFLSIVHLTQITNPYLML